MSHRQRRKPIDHQLAIAIEKIGGSGFEDETPEEGFSGGALAPSTFLPGRPTTSRSDQQ
jgi:hypothetical protein